LVAGQEKKMSTQISDQEQEGKSLGDYVSPIAWTKRSPDPNKTVFNEWAYDIVYMSCVLNPILLLFFFMIKWFTDIRINNDVFIYFDPLFYIFSMVAHGLMIKYYPYLAKINKFVALLSIKAIPVLILFGLCGRLISQ
jgi:hypothetical protein